MTQHFLDPCRSASLWQHQNKVKRKRNFALFLNDVQLFDTDVIATFPQKKRTKTARNVNKTKVNIFEKVQEYLKPFPFSLTSRFFLVWLVDCCDCPCCCCCWFWVDCWFCWFDLLLVFCPQFFSLIILKSICHLAPARLGMNLSLHLSGFTGEMPLGDGGRDLERWRFANGDEEGWEIKFKKLKL